MAAGLKTAVWVALAGAGLVAFAVGLTPAAYRVALELGWVDADEFLKVTRRLLLIPGILLVFAWLRPWRDGGPASYGLLGERARGRPAVLAYGVTLAVGLTVLASHFGAGWLTWEDPLDVGGALKRLGRWAVMAWPLAIAEEWFFRGWLDRRFRRRVSPALAAASVALVYAAIHAFKPSRLDVEVTHDVAGAWTGFTWWVRHLVDPVRFGPTFAGLFLFSLVLTSLWRRTRTLWVPIAVHAAGITLLRTYGAFTVRAPDRNWAGTKELVDGPVLWAVFLGLLLWVWARRPREGSDANGL